MTLETRIDEIMTRDLIVLEEWENLSDVAHDMTRHHLRHLPVVDKGRLVGLVSHRDLLRYTTSEPGPQGIAASRDLRQKESTFVFSIMIRDVTTIGPHAPVADAVRLLLSTGFGCLPVVDDEGLLVGIVSERDLLKLLAGMLKLKASAWSAAESHRPEALSGPMEDSLPVTK